MALEADADDGIAGQTEMVLRVARAIDGGADPTPASIVRARAAIIALKNPTPDVNAAIRRGQPGELHVAMELGYERGLDAALGGWFR